jgi:hypothetical protein
MDEQTTKQTNRPEVYFENLNTFGSQILNLRNNVFDFSNKGFVSDYVEKYGLNTRNILVDRMSGNERFLRNGVLIGLVCTDFIKKDSIRHGIQSLTNTMKYTENIVESPGANYVNKIVDKVVSKPSISREHEYELRPVTESLEIVLGTNNDYEHDYFARESVWRGYILGVNTVITMCDDWTEWVSEVRTKTFQSRQKF